MRKLLILTGFLLLFFKVEAQYIDLKNVKLEANKTYLSFEKLQGKEVLKVLIDTTIENFDEPTFVKLTDSQFRNGSIEVKVLSRIVKNAPASARGFIGVAYRIDPNNKAFESIYVRPTNGRAEDQVRRNHSIQYFSFPDFKFDRLRKEAPEKYESYADMGLNEWIKLKIVVEGAKSRLYVNNSRQPALVVNDMKLGPEANGQIGLWVGNYTEGYFKDLKISPIK